MPNDIVNEASPARRGARMRRNNRHWTAEERRDHRNFEKERREAFREELVVLASHLPALANDKPLSLSKHVVVEAAIEHIKREKQALFTALNHIRALVQERDALLSEANQWRRHSGLPEIYGNGLPCEFVKAITPEEDEEWEQDLELSNNAYTSPWLETAHVNPLVAQSILGPSQLEQGVGAQVQSSTRPIDMQSTSMLDSSTRFPSDDHIPRSNVLVPIAPSRSPGLDDFLPQTLGQTTALELNSPSIVYGTNPTGFELPPEGFPQVYNSSTWNFGL